MKQRELSGEEKLLRLIKGVTKKHPESDVNKDLPDQQPDSISTNAGHKIIAQKIVVPVQIKIHPPFFKITYFFLLFLVVTSLLYLLASFIFNSNRPEAVIQYNSTQITEIEEFVEDQVRPKLEPYSYYSSQITKRDLFSSSVTQPQNQNPGGVLLGQVIQDLNLIGIVSGDNPQAIVEDGKSKKTYFLNKGDQVGEFVVEDIQKGKIILDLRGQKFELSL